MAHKRFSVAAMALLVAAVFLWIAVGRSPEPAWADVGQKITEADTMVCWSSDLKKKPLYFTQKVFIRKPNLVRAEDYATALLTGSAPADRTVPSSVMLFNIPDGPNRTADVFNTWQGSWVRQIRFGSLARAQELNNQPADLLGALKAVATAGAARDGEEVVDGVKTVKFTSKVTDELRKALRLPPVTGSVTVWVAEGTSLPVRVHMKITAQLGERVDHLEWVIDHIEWNVKIPPQLMELPKAIPGRCQDKWDLYVPGALEKKDFKIDVRVKGGTPIANEQDGNVVDSPGSRNPVPRDFLFHFSPEASKRIEQATEKHVGDTLVVTVANQWTFERKIDVKVTVITVYFGGSEARSKTVP